MDQDPSAVLSPLPEQLEGNILRFFVTTRTSICLPKVSIPRTRFMSTESTGSAGGDNIYKEDICMEEADGEEGDSDIDEAYKADGEEGDSDIDDEANEADGEEGNSDVDEEADETPVTEVMLDLPRRVRVRLRVRLRVRARG